MDIVTDIGQDKLDAFVKSQKHSSFLQSWDWGEFQESTGLRVIRFGLKGEEGLIWAGSGYLKNIFGFKYLYFPRISIKHLSESRRQELFRAWLKIGRENACAFIRFEPRSDLGAETRGFTVVPTIAVQPAQTQYLDLGLEEDALQSAMHPKTRYNIRLADKKGVSVRLSGTGDFATFWYIMEETAKRDRFRLHDRHYYKRMLALQWIKLLLAEKDGRLLAGNIVSFFPGDTAVYIHGASANEGRALMAPYALQWATIKLARAQGLKYYDFNGIDEKKWPGVTRFKLGFGGERVVYPGTFDLVVDKRRYLVYRALRKLRRLF